MSGRFDAVLFDAGGVLVLPDPTVLAPLLAPLGASTALDRHHRAHYAAMAGKSAANSAERDWSQYNLTYVSTVGVDDEHLDHAAELLDHTRSAYLWRFPIADTLAALFALGAAGVPMGVVSNASGQIADMLLRTEICQVGTGPGVSMRVVVDSEVVGVAKPDPRIFDFALPHFADYERSRIAYVGDSVIMDVVSARAAGLHPLLVDPYDDHAGADFERVRAVTDIIPWF